MSIQPDLPVRFKKGLALTPYQRDKFYVPGVPDGYIDYLFADAESQRVYETRKGEFWRELTQ